jgi:peptidoglycan/LPS O-acetylase OafA/YrhL
VLSGYLITGVLLADREARLGPYLRRFYWRRTLRIFPLYYGYLAVVAAVFLFSGRPRDFGGAAGWLFSYTYNFSRFRPDWEASPFFTHFWSLAVEEQFYLVWPFVVHALGRRALALAAAAMVVLAPAAVAAAGAANLRALTASEADLPMGTLGFPLASIANGFHVWGYSLLNLASAALVCAAVAAHRLGGAVNLLSAAPLAGLGRISYGVYVLHWPLLALFNAHVGYRPMTARGALLCAAWFLLVCGAAWISHRFYETRFLALKDRVGGRVGGLRAA